MSVEDTDTRMTPDDVLRRFVAAESTAPENTDGQDEMRARLAATLGIALTGTVAPHAAAEATTKVIGRGAIAHAPAIVKAALLLGIGFGAGFGVRATLAPQRTPSSEYSMPPTAPSSKIPIVVETAHSIAPDTVDITNLPIAPPTAVSTAAPTGKTTAPLAVGDAEAERLLLETARVAMRRGDREGALRLLQEHRTRFPQGQLREERDGLNVSALSLLGRKDEALKAAARFRKDYPMSLQAIATPELGDAGH